MERPISATDLMQFVLYNKDADNMFFKYCKNEDAIESSEGLDNVAIFQYDEAREICNSNQDLNIGIICFREAIINEYIIEETFNN